MKAVVQFRSNQAVSGCPCAGFSRVSLRTDRIDLLQLHGPQDWVIEFPDAPSLTEAGEALARLKSDGDVLNVGVRNLPVEQLEELSEAIRLFSTQNLYSMYDQEAAEDGIHLPVGQSIIPWAREHALHVFAFSPLARGLLADNLSPDRTFTSDDGRVSTRCTCLPSARWPEGSLPIISRRIGLSHPTTSGTSCPGFNRTCFPFGPGSPTGSRAGPAITDILSSSSRLLGL